MICKSYNFEQCAHGAKERNEFSGKIYTLLVPLPCLVLVFRTSTCTFLSTFSHLLLGLAASCLACVGYKHASFKVRCPHQDLLVYS